MLPDYRASIDERISRDKILVEKKMPSQFRSQIVEPLQEIVKQGKRVQPKAIFIDGLSDCAGGDAQAVIWSLLFDDKQELLGAPSKAEVRDIDNLEIAIEEQCSELVNVKAVDLVVWQCKKLQSCRNTFRNQSVAGPSSWWDFKFIFLLLFSSMFSRPVL